MLSKVFTTSVIGIEGSLITVETNISRGLPCYNVVGLGGTVIREAGSRIRAAISNSGLEYPLTKIDVNLCPASSRKEGSHFDLPLALGILSSSGQVVIPEKMAFFGELSMDGKINRVDGILPMVLAAKNSGIEKIIVPTGNIKEAGLAMDVELLPANTLMQVVSHLKNDEKIAPYERNPYNENDELSPDTPDYRDVIGQENAKRALMIAAGGGHGIFMIGPPGSGKTMLAERLPGILPPISYEEKLEITKVHSVAGLLDEENQLVRHRPFRRVYSDITLAALLGGGRKPKPGEISLAHKGVLFIDEFPMLTSKIIESLRIPLEENKVIISRSEYRAEFPAEIMLISAANPCLCGNRASSGKMCTCTPGQLAAYDRKISDMILDRIDMHISVDAVDPMKISSKEELMSTKEMRERVAFARERQRKRYSNDMLNAKLTKSQIEKYIVLNDGVREFLRKAYDTMALTMRTYNKTLTISRTIADMEGEEEISINHVAEALQYRSKGYEV